mmetsp:Transcript_64828/g.211294  ORF Transcript_64828/g.211294 Transcript_64828/m.211294 type:complete len:298 (-) Transcript_64828:884-1777(-)
MPAETTPALPALPVSRPTPCSALNTAASIWVNSCDILSLPSSLRWPGKSAPEAASSAADDEGSTEASAAMSRERDAVAEVRHFLVALVAGAGLVSTGSNALELLPELLALSSSGSVSFCFTTSESTASASAGAAPTIADAFSPLPRPWPGRPPPSTTCHPSPPLSLPLSLTALSAGAAAAALSAEALPGDNCCGFNCSCGFGCGCSRAARSSARRTSHSRSIASSRERARSSQASAAFLASATTSSAERSPEVSPPSGALGLANNSKSTPCVLSPAPPKVSSRLAHCPNAGLLALCS